MTGKVIQGLFIEGHRPLPTAAGQPTAPSRIGPPRPAFAGEGPAAQMYGAGKAFQVDIARLGLSPGGGQPLPEPVRKRMETALGADFAGVRVHVGPQAERIGAIAFTLGSDIYFAPGRYQPDTVQGRQVLGHELAHVVQQRAGRVPNPLGTGTAVVQDRVLEAEADRIGHRAAAHPIAIQPKIQPKIAAAAQPSSSVRISGPLSAGPGSYRLTAGAGGRSIGSVMVHARDRGSVEITDLRVDPVHREHGIGKRLLASAARTAQQIGRTRLTLAAQDNGSGHLTRWYKQLGFSQTGVNRRGYPELEGPAGRILTQALQRSVDLISALTDQAAAPPPTRFAPPGMRERDSRTFSAQPSRSGIVLQRMERPNKQEKKAAKKPPRHGRSNKRNVEKNSLGDLYAVVETDEGSSILHDYKAKKGLGGASLEQDVLENEVFGEGEEEEKLVLDLTAFKESKKATPMKAQRGKIKQKEVWLCPACTKSLGPRYDPIPNQCPHCEQALAGS